MDHPLKITILKQCFQPMHPATKRAAVAMYVGNTGETMNTAQVMVELLKEYRVEDIFGVPGDTTMVLYDALYAARHQITHIMAGDERSAAFTADDYARTMTD